jgi:putative hemolysin
MIRSMLLAVGLLVAATGGLARAQSDDATPVALDGTPVPAIDLAAAADYCVANGGIVRDRYPAWGTNLPADQWLQLGGSRQFCEFTGGAGAEPPTSWISLSLETLYSELPTLATLAYLTQPPLPTTSGSVNPSAVYCTQLGGAYDFGGVSANGGGWVTLDPEPALQVLEFCVFPDGSMIDAWGIAYHSDGTIRGADLTPILRYQSANPPRVFAGQ